MSLPLGKKKVIMSSQSHLSFLVSLLTSIICLLQSERTLFPVTELLLLAHGDTKKGGDYTCKTAFRLNMLEIKQV